MPRRIFLCRGAVGRLQPLVTFLSYKFVEHSISNIDFFFLHKLPTTSHTNQYFVTVVCFPYLTTKIIFLIQMNTFNFYFQVEKPYIAGLLMFVERYPHSHLPI